MTGSVVKDVLVGLWRGAPGKTLCFRRQMRGWGRFDFAVRIAALSSTASLSMTDREWAARPDGSGPPEF